VAAAPAAAHGAFQDGRCARPAKAAAQPAAARKSFLLLPVGVCS
jgi:hypothetical protein